MPVENYIKQPTITIDTTPPEITNVMVNPTIVSSGTPICISANVFDIDKVSLVRAFITKEGEQVATVFMHDPDGDGVYIGIWRTLSSYTEPGIYSIDISATDREGHEALAKAPEVEITSEATGSISIHSSPSGATIGLETPVGMFVGPAVKTPHTFTNVPVGTSTITLYLESYQDWSTKVMVRAGETTYVDAMETY